MKQLIGTVFLVTLLTLTIVAFNKTDKPSSNAPATSVTSAKITE